MPTEQPTLTAAELREIGERIVDHDGTCDWRHADDDRARLYVAVERMIGVAIMKSGNRYCIPGMPGDLQWFRTKDAAIDALLKSNLKPGFGRPD